MRSGGLILAVVLLAGVPALAADEAEVLRLRAEQLAAQDRCEEALPRARQARDLAPGDAAAALVEGRCALRLNQYERAAEALEIAQRLDPSIAGLHADLAVAYFHSGRKRDSGRALDAAEAESPNDARVPLYRGLLLLDASENEEAAAEFERAASLDSELSPLAGYYAGRAWQDDENRERAEAALQEVKDRAPGTTWAEQADLALTRLDEPYLPHRWVRLQAGMDYDSNVVLRGDNVRLPQNISDERDGRGWWSTDFGWEFLRTPQWSMGLSPAYSGDANVDLSRFNLQYPNISGWIDRRIDEVSFMRLRPHYGFAWRDGDPYVSTGGGELSYQRFFGDIGSGRLFTEATGSDYRFFQTDKPVTRAANDGNCGIPQNCDPDDLGSLDSTVSRARDRDGVLLTAGYEHTLGVAADTLFASYLRGGIAGGHYFSQGEEYEHDTVKVWLGANKDLIAGFTLDVMGSYAYEPYQNRSTFLSFNQLVSCPPGAAPCTLRGGSDREENVWNTRVLLERSFNDAVTGTLRWHYQNNDSNTRTYKYDRHIVGGYITIYFSG